ncbi:hypothetical protein ACTQ56_12405 [[Clostridium] aminophilum]|uniref:hypothetical protein n=1 Tax=[Clostridium] aminophilum TaxID=1526 RepID=UPI003F9D3BA1
MSTATYEFELPGALIVTPNVRKHWARQASLVRNLRQMAAVTQGHDPHQMQRAHLTVHVAYPDRRRRDAHNLNPTIKALVDGLVSGCGWRPHGWVPLLPDDDDTHLIGPDWRPQAERCKPGHVRLTLIFQEVDG